ncbi:chromosomal replication initiator protein DnaA [Ignatzschineria sp. RMDPL8A]|uniref:chromosomal replication initiator protein DnaA n=1 Tax=Ignatzschineria sp. RMDPL8A TaxID=2999236 RepID=UPI001699DC34|nr:chromosomal replication initiator protein DnaA [Ignatzschineria sp. RMDPL8A]MDG9728827.1 chromosomal replication initiator protein DnaA [Ignatzschineria sp. RMDPL8A]NLD08333.1 chromosomal replication initiator protein DnaA [Xanthomonadaceae bacterium]
MGIFNWENCLRYLEEHLTQDEFVMWISPLNVVMKDDHAMILATNEIVLRGVQTKFEDLLLAAIEEELGAEIELRYGVGTESDYEDHQVQKRSSKRRERSGKAREVTKYSVREQSIETSNLNKDFQFSNFVEGKSNTFALAACSQVSKKPGTSHNPLFIYGNTGLGKTHLMHAIGNSIKERYPDARLIYQHCDGFIEDIVRSIRNNTINELRHFYKTLDALLIDDIQLLSGKEGSQEVFFHTFNTLLDGGHQVILTCDRYPKELDAMEERLKSRFASGLIVDIQPPGLEHRIAILMQKAEAWGIDLPSETAFFIGQTVRANVRELEGALKQTNALASFKGMPLSLEVAQDALQHLTELQDRQITLTNIQKTVTSYFDLDANDLVSKSRKANIVRPRQLAMYISRELTDHSLPEIGRAFSRDHSTVMHACQRIQEELETNIRLRRDFEALKASLLV